MPPTHCLGCCSNCGNSGWGQQPAAQTAPAPVPVLRVTSSLSLEEPGPKKQLLPNASTSPLGCCSGARDRHPELTPPGLQGRAFHPHILCATVACDAGTASPAPSAPSPGRFPTGSAPSPGRPRWSRTGAGLLTGSSATSQTDLLSSRGPRLPSLADAPQPPRAL